MNHRPSALRFACALLLFAVLGGLTYAPDALAGYERCYGTVAKTKSDKEWNWVRTTMTVRSGIISSSDATNGYFVANVLWAYTAGVFTPADTSDDQWVEVGLTRGWNESDILTLYWAERHYIPLDRRYVYLEHRISSPSIAGGDTVAVRLSHISGGMAAANWGIYVNNSHKATSDQQADDHVHFIACGLENTASSGKLGTFSNPVHNTNMLRSQDGGATSNGWEGDGLSYNVDEDHKVYADWQVTGEWWWDLRNW